MTWRSAWLGALVIAGCGGVELGPDDVILERAEVTSLRTAAAAMPELRAEIATLRAERQALNERVRVLEARLGVAAFEPTELTAFDAQDARIALPDAQVLDAPDAEPRRRRLSRVLADTERGVVIAFWATWCEPCIADDELALLRGLQAQLRDHGVELVSVAVDGLDDVRSHASAGQFIYPIFQRDRGHYDILPRRFITEVGVDLPLFLVVSRAGDAVWYRARQLSDAAVRDLVTAAARL